MILKRTSAALAAIALVSMAAHASEASGPTLQTPDLRIVEELLRIPEAQLSIGEAALRLSALMLPETNLKAGLEQIDSLARRVALVVGSRSDAEFRIRAINTVLYQEENFDYDRDDMLGRKPENAFLWHYLTLRRGNCQTMPLLWYSIAERLMYPVKAVLAPQHLFLRYDDGKSRVNIEATSGSVPTDQQIIRALDIPHEGIRSGAYMRSLSKRELLAALIADLGNRQVALMNFGLAEQLLTASAQVLPNSVATQWGLAVAYSGMANARAAQKAAFAALHGGSRAAGTRIGRVDEFDKAIQHARRATELGAPPPLQDGYWKKVKKLSEPRAATQLTGQPRPFDVAQLVRPPSRIIIEGKDRIVERERTVINRAPPSSLSCAECPACPSARTATTAAWASGGAIDACGQCRQTYGSTVDTCVDMARDTECRTCAAEQKQSAGTGSTQWSSEDGVMTASNACASCLQRFSSVRCETLKMTGSCRQCLEER